MPYGQVLNNPGLCSNDLDSNPSVCVHRGPDANFPIQKHKMSKWHLLFRVMGFPGGSVSKESACNVGGPGLLPGSGRSRGEGNGSPLQCSCLGGPMDRGAWGATVHGIAKSRTCLSNFTSLSLLSLTICRSIHVAADGIISFLLWQTVTSLVF